MKTIYKYKAPFMDELTLNLPKGAKILSVQMQPGFADPQLWALVSPERPTMPLRFRWYGTGHTLPEWPGEYIATCQWQNLVFHLFEV